MKVVDKFEDLEVPSYALSYLVNGDSSGMDEDGIEDCDRWYDWFMKKLKKNQSIIFSIEEDEDGNSETYFSDNPEFGLPCDVNKCTITILESEV